MSLGYILCCFNSQLSAILKRYIIGFCIVGSFDIHMRVARKGTAGHVLSQSHYNNSISSIGIIAEYAYIHSIIAAFFYICHDNRLERYVGRSVITRDCLCRNTLRIYRLSCIVFIRYLLKLRRNSIFSDKSYGIFIKLA